MTALNYTSIPVPPKQEELKGLVGASERSLPIGDSDFEDIFNTKPKEIPERGLLAGILELAFRDLGPVGSRIEKVGAVRWFRCENDEYLILDSSDPRFTFKEVALYLDLGLREIKIIFDAVTNAEKELLR